MHFVSKYAIYLIWVLGFSILTGCLSQQSGSTIVEIESESSSDATDACSPGYVSSSEKKANSSSQKKVGTNPVAKNQESSNTTESSIEESLSKNSSVEKEEHVVSSERDASCAEFVSSSSDILEVSSLEEIFSSSQKISSSVIVPSSQVSSSEVAQQSSSVQLSSYLEISSSSEIIQYTCSDGLMNGLEEKTDCGGPECDACEDEGWDFYLEIGGDAKKEYDGFVEDGNTEDAELMARIAFTPIAHWYGDWFGTDVIESRVDGLLSDAVDQGVPAVIVLYAIVGRDCSAYSSGGMETEEEYLDWITNVAKSFKGRGPWVILEPDGLAMLGECKMGDRVGMMQKASQILTNAGGRVYIDLANSGWKSVEERIALIDSIGTEFIHGFASNVANTESIEDEIADGEAIATATGTRYVIDTGRNGNGSNGEWCNPEGRALGEMPRVVNEGALDAYLWIKGPGWSDGECNDGPAAGKWFASYGLELARNAAANE